MTRVVGLVNAPGQEQRRQEAAHALQGTAGWEPIMRCALERPTGVPGRKKECQPLDGKTKQGW